MLGQNSSPALKQLGPMTGPSRKPEQLAPYSSQPTVVISPLDYQTLSCGSRGS